MDCKEDTKKVVKIEERKSIATLIYNMDEKVTKRFIASRVADLAYTNIKFGKNTPAEIDNRLNESAEIIQSFCPEDGTQLMLAAQMAAVHQMQQRLMMYSYNGDQSLESMTHYINAIAKLSNVFIQQINAMNKLKGVNQPKVTIEHVHVHNGGQAVVGTINTSTERKK